MPENDSIISTDRQKKFLGHIISKDDLELLMLSAKIEEKQAKNNTVSN